MRTRAEVVATGTVRKERHGFENQAPVGRQETGASQDLGNLADNLV